MTRLKTTMKTDSIPWRALLPAAALALVFPPGCGGTGAGNPNNGNVLVQSAPLAGPNAAFRLRTTPLYARVLDSLGVGLGRGLFGIQPAIAAVSPFAVFRACNDTLNFIDMNGTSVVVDGSAAPAVGQGLLNFSNSSPDPMTIGSIYLPPGTVLSEIDITFAVVPQICSGANYAVEFDNGAGSGLIDITQNTAFKFKFGGTGYTVPSTSTISLLFGQIVNGMVSLGSGLNNSTIQTVNVGQAQ